MEMGTKDFFRRWTIIRRRMNQIESLQNANNQWVEDSVELENMVLGYFIELYRSDPHTGSQFISRCFPGLGANAKVMLEESTRRKKFIMLCNKWVL